VTANRNHQAHGFNRESAHNECSALYGSRKEKHCRDRKKESGWHHQQSGIFHALILSANSPVDRGRPWTDVPKEKEMYGSEQPAEELL
jgi:hypothetical protein